MKLSIDTRLCKGCGICAAYCPKKVIAMTDKGKARIDNEEACIYCGLCEMRCPDFAVEITGKKEGSK
jgi:Indolepyruvate ferredoxin oxidoreductase, alpha and beta subunits